jgi:type II secretory pathway component GspD/PulD (secretin)
MAPPFQFDQGPPSSSGRRPPLRIHPRIDANFPIYGQNTYGAANAPAGLRRQWYEKAFGSPVLTQAVVHNYTRMNPLNSFLGDQFQTFPQQGAIFQFRFLQSTQASAILQAVRKDRTQDVLLSPRMVQFNNQRAHVLFAQQRAYIADYDVAGAVFDPVIRAFMTGVVLDVQPTVSSDKRYVTLTLRPGTAEELEPPQIIYITDGGDVDNPLGIINLPIELPNLELRSIHTSVTTPDGGTLLFSGLITDRRMDAKSGIPFLSDLPIIGRLFSENHKERDRRNLLILVNAKILLFDEEEQRL